MDKNFKIIKTRPTDKSSSVYFDDVGRDLKASKPLLIIYQLTPTEISFKRANYVHSRKLWVDWEGCGICDDEFIGWYDVDNILQNDINKNLLKT